MLLIINFHQLRNMNSTGFPNRKWDANKMEQWSTINKKNEVSEKFNFPGTFL